MVHLLVMARSRMSSSAFLALMMSSTRLTDGYSRPMTGVDSSKVNLPNAPDGVKGSGYFVSRWSGIERCSVAVMVVVDILAKLFDKILSI